MGKNLLCMYLGSLLFLASCSSSRFSVRESREIPEDFVGLVHAGRTRSEQEYALIDELGASWLLATFYWNDIEKEQGAWDFASHPV
jgi:hypothetical protein